VARRGQACHNALARPKQWSLPLLSSPLAASRLACAASYLPRAPQIDGHNMIMKLICFALKASIVVTCLLALTCLPEWRARAPALKVCRPPALRSWRCNATPTGEDSLIVATKRALALPCLAPASSLPKWPGELEGARRGFLCGQASGKQARQIGLSGRRAN